jgi:hypothetical protein
MLPECSLNVPLKLVTVPPTEPGIGVGGGDNTECSPNVP